MHIGMKLLSGSVLAVIGLLAVKLFMSLFGAVVGLVGFLLTTVLPIVLIGWLVMKVIKHFKEKPAYEE